MKLDGRVLPGIAMLSGDIKGQISSMLVDEGMGVQEANLSFTTLVSTSSPVQVPQLSVLRHESGQSLTNPGQNGR